MDDLASITWQERKERALAEITISLKIIDAAKKVRLARKYTDGTDELKDLYACLDELEKLNG